MVRCIEAHEDPGTRRLTAHLASFYSSPIRRRSISAVVFSLDAALEHYSHVEVATESTVDV